MSSNDKPPRKARIFYARVDEFWRKGEKYAFLDEKQHIGNIEWRELQPDAKNNWLMEGHRNDYETFIPIALTQKGKSSTTGVEAIFDVLSNGVQTNRDVWVYNFNKQVLEENVKRTMDVYNDHVHKWHSQRKQNKDVDSFVLADEMKIKWSSRLKESLLANTLITFDQQKIRPAVYRPFTIQYLYFDLVLNQRRGQFPHIFPTLTTVDNQVIWLKVGGDWPMFALATNHIADQLPQGGSQCFPFYSYEEDGTHRRENITDWALAQFRAHYGDEAISKWDIFHYVYAVLHHPQYRARYAANLKRELPRIPFAGARAGTSPAPTEVFRAFADTGARLAELHVHYEQQPEYPLTRSEQAGVALNWRVERMRFGKDKRSLVYNDFLTLSDIPPEAFDYRLGNRSALEWIVDQYQVTTDKRSGIINDPNRPADPQYILRLVGQVVTVSLETVKLVHTLPALAPQPDPAGAESAS